MRNNSHIHKLTIGALLLVNSLNSSQVAAIRSMTEPKHQDKGLDKAAEIADEKILTAGETEVLPKKFSIFGDEKTEDLLVPEPKMPETGAADKYSILEDTLVGDDETVGAEEGILSAKENVKTGAEKIIDLGLDETADIPDIELETAAIDGEDNLITDIGEIIPVEVVEKIPEDIPVGVAEEIIEDKIVANELKREEILETVEELNEVASELKEENAELA